MQHATLIDRAAATMIEVVHGIAPDQMDAPTPCPDYRVRQLVNHLLFWAPSLAGAARKDAVPPPAGSEHEVDLATTDWAARLEADISRLVEAWSDPAAWEGQTRLGSPEPAPAPMIGGMVATELVLHGWDLARATDQKPEWDADVVAFVHDELAATAEFGREMGLYGPAVDVPATASQMDRALGLSGRDPAWSRPDPVG